MKTDVGKMCNSRVTGRYKESHDDDGDPCRADDREVRVDKIDRASDRLEARLMRRTRCEYHGPPPR
jgi:hypothetical protein